MRTVSKAQIFVASVFMLVWVSVAHTAVPDSERQVLLSLYASTGGAQWTNNTNWNGDVGTECTWYGISCDGLQEHVTEIRLLGNNLIGTLPSLSGLTALRKFIVSSDFFFDSAENHLSGTIPSLTGLTALQEFAADGNHLTGSIPPLNGLTALQYFSVTNNELTGSIPSLAGLAALWQFTVSNNQLTGSIPALTGLTAMRYFSVNNNQLTGSIPSLTGLTALSSFWASDNQLTGSVPDLSGLTALESFNVSINQLTGSIPDLGGLAALWGFFAHDNQLSGSIPSLSGLATLSYFHVGNNQLSGTIPDLSGLTALQSFYVNNNQLTGTIPSLAGLTALSYFDVYNNQFSGQAPAPPSSLAASASDLCGNSLASNGDSAIDAAWVTATGTDWLSCQRSGVDTPVIGNPSRSLSAPPLLQASYTVNTGELPEKAAAVSTEGTLGSATVTVQLDLGKVLAASFAAEESYNVYVAALVPGRQLGSESDTWFVNASNIGWQVLGSPIASYLQNVASGSVDQQIVIEIVRDTNITTLIGTEVYIGYGTSDAEMLEARRYRGVYKVE